jgi:hypothetical protein
MCWIRGELRAEFAMSYHEDKSVDDLKDGMPERRERAGEIRGDWGKTPPEHCVT